MFDQAISAISEYTKKIIFYVLSNYGIHISWTFSFFVNRFISRGPNESYRQSGVMAAGVAGVAAIDYALRDKEYVDTYAITYGTMVASTVYPVAYTGIPLRPWFNNELMSVIAFISSICAGYGVGVVVHYGYVPQSVAPTMTTFVNYKMHGPMAAIASGTLSIADEVMIYNNITDNHYLSTLVLSQGVLSHFLPNNYAYALSGGVIFIASPYESEILEAFLPINSTRQTYNVLLKISGDNSKSVNRILEERLVITANIELSYGGLIIRTLKITNQWFSLFGEACSNPTEVAPEFIKFSKEMMVFDFQKTTMHGLPLIPVEDYMLWDVKKHFKDQFFYRNIYNSSQFILISKSQYSAAMYSEDVSTIIETHWFMYQEIMKSIPSIMLLTSLGKNALVIPVIGVIDYVCTVGMNGLQKWMQEIREAQGISGNQMGVIEKHDSEYATSLVQTGALPHMTYQWQNAINDIDNLVLRNEFVSDGYHSIYNLYWEVGLWGGLPVVIVALAAKGVIVSQDIFPAVVSIKNSIATLLIKSKKQHDLNSAEISIKRLHDLFDSIENQRPMSQDVEIDYNDNEVLRVDNFTYVRGNEDGNVTVMIPSISFAMGKKYVVTGGNGSGKSSFLLLLNWLLNSVNDDSFLEVEGSVSYPGKQLSIVTQKEYCPVNTDMFSWLVFPKDPRGFSDEEKQSYQVKVVDLLEKLKFSPKNLTTIAEEFHTAKNNWCGDLSGGQVKKIQLMQQIFIPDACPKVLLMDEVMGPLDPVSKGIVQQMINDYCKDSLIISVQHYDNNVECVSSNSGYDYNIHFENGTVVERSFCDLDTTF